jgi:hypothetical protein
MSEVIIYDGELVKLVKVPERGPYAFDFIFPAGRRNDPEEEARQTRAAGRALLGYMREVTGLE